MLRRKKKDEPKRRLTDEQKAHAAAALEAEAKDALDQSREARQRKAKELRNG